MAKWYRAPVTFFTVNKPHSSDSWQMETYTQLSIGITWIGISLLVQGRVLRFWIAMRNTHASPMLLVCRYTDLLEVVFETIHVFLISELALWVFLGRLRDVAPALQVYNRRQWAISI